MCGIAGVAFDSSDTRVLTAMLGLIAHRGPDDQGVWHDAESGLGLGHRRLSIVDLSAAGHQPMVSASGRYVLTYNGEIYNHVDLRHQVEHVAPDVVWRGHSDTEVLLAAIECWGIRRALQASNGMFAIAVWDAADRTLTLARDRMGEKPLYFGWVDGRFAFASELKAFSALPQWTPRMCTHAIGSYLSGGYVRGLASAIAGVWRLPPASMLDIDVASLRGERSRHWIESRLCTYWSLDDAVRDVATADPGDDLDTIRALVEDSIRLRQSADVPLGAFLSGGIDSSLIVALMQHNAARRVHTFSIGFEDASLDEAPHARAVAAHLGTDHHELYCSEQDALDLVPDVPRTFDEPFADDSVLPTLLVSKMARRDVTVVLSGDGGDELFAGYGRYFGLLAARRLRERWPMLPWLADLAARSLELVDGIAPSTLSRLALRVDRLAGRIAHSDIDAMRLAFAGPRMSSFVSPDALRGVDDHWRAPGSLISPLRRLMYADQRDYLPDDILLKVDRASMRHSLETRVPFLDHRLVEYAWRLPDAALVAGGVGKQPLRDLLARYVPRTITDRPKQGFVPPTARWLRGGLRDWAEDLLSESSLRDLPMLDAKALRSAWRSHVAGQSDHAAVLWRILMLAAWRRAFGVVS